MSDEFDLISPQGTPEAPAPEETPAPSGCLLRSRRDSAEPQPAKRKNNTVKSIVETVELVVVALAVAILVLTLIFFGIYWAITPEGLKDFGQLKTAISYFYLLFVPATFVYGLV